MDGKSIKILVRDINGKRLEIVLENVAVFQGFDWDWYDDDNYEILMVVWGNHCVYNALINDEIYLEDLFGFFG